MWISPELPDEDLVLSKAAMFNLGFRLTTITGKDVWDENGDLKLEFLNGNEDLGDEPPKAEDIEVKEVQDRMRPQVSCWVRHFAEDSKIFQ